MNDIIELQGQINQNVQPQNHELVPLEESPAVIFDDVSTMSDVDILKFRDKRGKKIQFVAAECGNLQTINELVRRGFEFGEEDKDGKTPVDVAYSKKHFPVVHQLLKANFKFPREYCNETSSEELQAFVKLILNLHDYITNDNLEGVKEILSKYPNMKYFYDTQNRSAAHVAIELKKFEIYEFLLEKGVYIAPHEDFDMLKLLLTDEELSILSKIHEKLSRNVLVEPMSTLMHNSFFGPDCPDQVKYRAFVCEAYSFLLQITQIAMILNVVAASKMFKVVFDFKREFVTYIDPKSEPYSSTDGICYLSGRIYIGAKNMLDPLRRLEVFGVIAHELCHYAMFLVYENMARPYAKQNQIGADAFKEVVSECERAKDNENLISLVFECYPPAHYAAEIIVRVLQMLAIYYNSQHILESKKRFFPLLFGYFENPCMIDMEKAIPKIKKRFQSKKFVRQRKLTILVSILLLASIAISIPLGLWINSLNYSWDKLSVDQQKTVNNVIVDCYGVEVRFGDLFPNDSSVYSSLTAKEINGALENNTVDLSHGIKNVYDLLIQFKWSTLPERLKDKLLDSNVTFQGVEVEIDSFLSNSSETFNSLENSEIKQILNGTLISVASNVKECSKIYIERHFEYEKVIGEQKTFKEVVDDVSKVKLFILSSIAGEGKSTTFRNFAFKLKNQYSHKWIEFVDLKKNLEAFKIGNLTSFRTLNDLKSFMAYDLLNLTGFDRGVFKDRFQNNETVFLWDGADEISPLYKEFMIGLMLNVKTTTQNWQFISTRPQYSDDFSKNLNISSHKLVSLSKLERDQFLVKSALSNNFEDLDANEFCDELYDCKETEKLRNLSTIEDPKVKSYLKIFNDSTVHEISNVINTSLTILTSIERLSNNVTNPLLIQMAAGIGNKEGVNVANSLNHFSIYDIFIEKKLEIADEKGDVVKNDKDKIINKFALNYKRLYEWFALKLIFKEFLTKSYQQGLNFIEENINKLRKQFTNHELSRFGIITVISNDDFDFVHRTFAEFFVAQYLGRSIISVSSFSSQEELKFKMALLDFVFVKKSLPVVLNFVNGFFETKDFVNDSRLFVDYYSNSQNIKITQLEKLEINKKVSGFLEFYDFAYFFVKYHNVLFKTVFYNDREIWVTLDFKDFIINFDELAEIFDLQELANVLKLKTEKNRNYFFEYFKNPQIYSDSIKILNKLTSMYKKHFVDIDFTNYFSSEHDEINLLMIASYQDNLEALKALTHYNVTIEESHKNFLKVEDQETSFTTLESTALNKNVEFFNFMKEFYRKNLNEREIRALITRSSKKQPLSFIHNVFLEGSDANCEAVSKYLLELFKDDLISLKSLLSRRDRGETIASTLKYQLKYDKLKKFRDFLNKTKSPGEDFKFDFEDLTTSSFVMRVFDCFEVCHTFDESFNVSKLASHKWMPADFKYFVENWESIHKILGDENFRHLLTFKDDEDFVLNYLFKQPQHDQVVDKFLSKLKPFLSKAEKTELLREGIVASKKSKPIEVELLNKFISEI